jgi:hypothetical protein
MIIVILPETSLQGCQAAYHSRSQTTRAWRHLLFLATLAPCFRIDLLER